MSAGLPSFAQHSLRVAREFVQTVVFLDDHAFDGVGPEPEAVALQAPEEPIEDAEPKDEEVLPPRSAASGHLPRQVEEHDPGDVRAGGLAASGSQAETGEQATKESGLDPKTLIEAFASDGLVCAVLQPEKSGDSRAVLDAARRADIVVLDWMIHGDPGGKTIVLLREMLKADDARGGRLRLIAVYTVEPDLPRIVDTLHERLTEHPCVIENGGLSLRGKHFRIVALAKGDARIPAESPISRNIVGIPELPGRLYSEFAELAEGLVSNVALKGLSVLRDNTHVVLARFGASLDAGFLAHRLLLESPDDAGDHVVEILGSEFTSMLQAYEIRDEVNVERIEGWLRLRAPKVKLPWDNREWDPDHFTSAFSEGLAPWTVRNNCGGKSAVAKHHAALSRMFVKDGVAGAGDESNLRYAEATSFAFRYEKGVAAEQESTATPPRLTLGTVIKGETGATESYFVCIQPRCDSVRLKPDSPPAFAFLKAKKVDPADRFDLAVLDGSGYVRLEVVNSVSNQALITFNPTNGVVRARRTEHGHDFEAVDPAGTYRWIGQLKDAHAQRMAQRFAASISRVGLNESEWLRRSSKIED